MMITRRWSVRSVILFALLVLVILLPVYADNGDKKRSPAGRLLIGDGETGLLQVLDLDRGRVIKKFEVDGPGWAYTTESGRFGAVVQLDDNQVNFIDSGLVLGDDDDDGEGDNKFKKRRPRLLPFDLDGASLGAINPIHFHSHEGKVSIHFDGSAGDGIDAHNYIIPESDLLKLRPDVLVLTTVAQHGVAIPVPGSRILFSDPDPAGEFGTLPSGFTIRDETGAILQTINDKSDPDASCPGMHGESETENQFMFACEDGILVLTQDQATHYFTGRKLSYPELSYPDAHRAFWVFSHHEQDIALAPILTPEHNFISIDPVAGIVELKDKLVEPSPCDYFGSMGFERQSGDLFAVLDTDGNLNVIDVHSWSKVGAVAVIEPFECNFTPQMPELAMGNGKAFVSDPTNGKVIEVDLDQVEITRTFNVDGVPRFMTVFGWDVHEDDDEDDDD